MVAEASLSLIGSPPRTMEWNRSETAVATPSGLYDFRILDAPDAGSHAYPFFAILSRPGTFGAIGRRTVQIPIRAERRAGRVNDPDCLGT